MNGTVILIGIVLFFIISGLINFVSDLENDGKNNSVYSPKEINDKQYYSLNIIGEQTLVLDSLSDTQKKEIWKKSPLKDEMLEFFPDFSLMSKFIEERIIDDGAFKKKLLKVLSYGKKN